MLIPLYVHEHFCMMRNGNSIVSRELLADEVHHKSQGYICSVPPVYKDMGRATVDRDCT